MPKRKPGPEHLAKLASYRLEAEARQEDRRYQEAEKVRARRLARDANREVRREVNRKRLLKNILRRDAIARRRERERLDLYQNAKRFQHHYRRIVCDRIVGEAPERAVVREQLGKDYKSLKAAVKSGQFNWARQLNARIAASEVMLKA